MPIDSESLLLAALFFAAALLYASVGHAGASGYLAAMALVGFVPETMRFTALALNIPVAAIATWKFYRVGSFSWRLFLPLAVASVPLAYLGGLRKLPPELYKPLVGAVLIYAAWRTFHTARRSADYPLRKVHPSVLVGTGGGLGFLAGLTGVGGGIFLSPLLLFLRWAPLRTISGVAAAFILVNSISGILGQVYAAAQPAELLAPALPLWALVVIVGGYIGAEYGSRRLGNPAIQRLLALALFIAGSKMVIEALLIILG